MGFKRSIHHPLSLAFHLYPLIPEHLPFPESFANQLAPVGVLLCQRYLPHSEPVFLLVQWYALG